MYHRNRNDALLDGLRQIGRAVDPELVTRAARDAGVTLPIDGGLISAPSFNNGMTAHGFTIAPHRLPELAGIVDRLLAKGGCAR